LKIKRIVSNVETSDVEKANAFYRDILGLRLVMDHGWIRTYGSDSKMTVQVSFASEGGSGTPVPDMSIEVDDIETVWRESRKRESRLSTVRKVSRGECAGSMYEIRSES
jgi:lactoylglutathione lyase